MGIEPTTNRLTADYSTTELQAKRSWERCVINTPCGMVFFRGILPPLAEWSVQESNLRYIRERDMSLPLDQPTIATNLVAICDLQIIQERSSLCTACTATLERRLIFTLKYLNYT